MTQQQPYTVLAQHKGFELRKYPAGIQIETTVGGDFVSAGNRGFRPLVEFISGNNKARQAIAMTAPVIQESAGASKHMVRFVMPAEMKPLARPVNPKLYENAKLEFQRLSKYMYTTTVSPIASPLVIAPKKTKPFIRFCGDYVAINKYIMAIQFRYRL